MNPIRKRKLTIIIFMLSGISIAVAFALYALRQNINLFYTPTQIVEKQVPLNRTFRVGGLVQKNSVKRNLKTLEVSFSVTDLKNNITIYYKGMLPDLFREGQGIVAEGKLNIKGEFIAHQVLAKHDEKYMPPEVKKSLVSTRSNQINKNKREKS